MYEELSKLCQKALEGSLKPKQLEEFKNNPDFMAAELEWDRRLQDALGMVSYVVDWALEDDVPEQDLPPWADQVESLGLLLRYILRQRRIGTKEKQELVEKLFVECLMQYPLEKAPKTLKRLMKANKKCFIFADQFMEQTNQGTDIIKECLGEEETEPIAKLVREYMEMRPEEKSDLVAKNREVRDNFCILRAIADEEEDCYSWRAQVDAVTDVLALLLDVKKDKTQEKREVVDLLAEVFFFASTRQQSNRKRADQFVEHWAERFAQGLAEIAAID